MIFPMAFVAFPLRLEKSFLAKCNEVEAVMQVLWVIARTPHGSWKGSKHFGVRDLFEGARSGSGETVDWEAAADEAKQADVRVVPLRLGVVLSRAGGALAHLLPKRID